MHVLVLTQNNIVSPKYGGGLRVSALIEQLLGQGHHVSVIRFRLPDDQPSTATTRLPIRDIVVPRTSQMASVAALIHLASRTAERMALAFHSESKVDLVQSDPPWAALTGQRIAERLGVPHVLLSQNCETALARQFADSSPAHRLPIVGPLVTNLNLGVLEWAEKRVIERATLTLTPSAGDREEMASVGIRLDHVEVLPNGTNVRQATRAERDAIRSRLNLAPATPTVIFVGRMDYPPNAEAVKVICTHIAPRCPDLKFLLVGLNPPAITTPDNVIMVGAVDSVDGYLGASDLSIVPILQGSGTRIKILDAWAAGLPVLSTSVGASGLNYEAGRHIMIEDDLA
ncbi:MAG: glycosyltransferase family 4 protein, partial [Chloroflexota bacterium]|nr:glycosyltransferase family 4 protein [Chloroflexota bacterium]